MPIRSLQAKHIILLNNKTAKIHSDAVAAGYPNVIWGYFRNGTVQTENTIINKMITDDFRKTIRVTITDKHVWCDNCHSAIAWMRRGAELIGEIPHYIVDLRAYPPVLAGKKEYIIWDDDSIRNAIRMAWRLKILDDRNGRVEEWTLGDLERQLSE